LNKTLNNLFSKKRKKGTVMLARFTILLSMSMVHVHVHVHAVGPCDILSKHKTPCVAAHSVVRALYGDYNGIK